MAENSSPSRHFRSLGVVWLGFGDKASTAANLHGRGLFSLFERDSVVEDDGGGSGWLWVN